MRRFLPVVVFLLIAAVSVRADQLLPTGEGTSWEYDSTETVTGAPPTHSAVTVRAGTNTLLGLDPAAITQIPLALAQRPAKPPEPPPLWDGHAAERVAAVVAES